jgi:phage recombination protein Bet
MPEAQKAGTQLAVIEKSNEIRIAAQLPAKEWPDERIKAIAKTVAPQGTGVPELALFLSTAHRYDLDPFVNEIWLVHDKQKDRLIVMTGRDAYLKIAMRDPAYEGINSGVVYEKDTFIQEKTKKGEVSIVHKIHSMQNRGRLVGAYCVAYNAKRLPVTVVRTWEHYSSLHGKPNWRNNPDDMIETRVIVAALRRQYNISGLYTESEFAGINEGDGALAELRENENVLAATNDRVAELRGRMAEIEGREEEVQEVQEAVVVEEVVNGPPTSEELFPEEEVDQSTGEILQDHGPAEVALDANIVKEEELGPEIAGEEMVDVEKAIRKKQIRYMALWDQQVGADAAFRHRWQKAAIAKESTKTWTIHEYDDAIELLESGHWASFVTAKGTSEVQTKAEI